MQLTHWACLGKSEACVTIIKTCIVYFGLCISDLQATKLCIQLHQLDSKQKHAISNNEKESLSCWVYCKDQRKRQVEFEMYPDYKGTFSEGMGRYGSQHGPLTINSIGRQNCAERNLVLQSKASRSI